jgi:hypothetical protein
MNETVLEIVTVCLAALAFVGILYLLPMVSRLRKRLTRAGIAEDSGDAAPGDLSPELIAVIAAAVAAASGMGTNEFRVVGVNRVEGSGSWNTPIWGHIDRLTSRSNIR